MLTQLPRTFMLAAIMSLTTAAFADPRSAIRDIVPIPVGTESREADSKHKERAQSIRGSGMSLADAILKAEATAGGPALMANVAGTKETKNARRAGKGEGVRVQTQCFANGTVQQIRVTANGAKKMGEADPDGGPIDEPGAIAAALKGFSLADAVAAAVKEKPGDAINAVAYKASNGKVMITVKIVDGDTLWTMDLDPATKNVAP